VRRVPPDEVELVVCGFGRLLRLFVALELPVFLAQALDARRRSA